MSMTRTLETCVLASLVQVKMGEEVSLDDVVGLQDWPVYGPRGCAASELQLNARRVLAFITLRSLLRSGLLEFRAENDAIILSAQLNHNGYHEGMWSITPEGKEMIDHIRSQQAPVDVTTWATSSTELVLRRTRVPSKAISALIWENNYLSQNPAIDGKGGVVKPWFRTNSTAAEDLAEWIINHTHYLNTIDGIGKTLAGQLVQWALNKTAAAKTISPFDTLDPTHLSVALFGDHP